MINGTREVSENPPSVALLCSKSESCFEVNFIKPYHQKMTVFAIDNFIKQVWLQRSKIGDTSKGNIQVGNILPTVCHKKQHFGCKNLKTVFKFSEIDP